MAEVWKPKPAGVAKVGLYTATIVSTKHIGNVKTAWGIKDMQQFVFQIKDADGDKHIHQQFPRTIEERSNINKLLRALGISIERVRTHGIDFDKLVGRTLNVSVFHTTKADGTHANVKPLPPTLTQKSEPEREVENHPESWCTGLHNGGPDLCCNSREGGSRFCSVHLREIEEQV